ncbi:MAG: glucosidase [Chlamydiae bacterium CG10_big_fil_rev_8_21_14_0_10_42_34]|nr:MAG: glucosidase [Chlamydiae bacterium CG10_big_fil_rev_8_21_14_0_10_42_34]
MNPESKRLEEHKKTDFSKEVPVWEKWGPYVSERGWGSVREDYSADGDAWNYFTHDQARMRTYRRCEDGIAGISDRFQVLLFAPAFWNGADPILKERLFGVNCYEGNHGEDVKELYYHLDATPTHSYLKYLYKYPHAAYPYDKLVSENQHRSAAKREFEIIDTGLFDEDRYFDIFIEYAKDGPEDICIKIEAFNRGPEAAPLHILPHLWFRNKWSWGKQRIGVPEISLEKGDELCLVAEEKDLKSPRYLLFDYYLGTRYLYATAGAEPLFTHNDSNMKALWNQPNETPYVKDAFHRYVIQGEKEAVNPERIGTKSALHYFFPQVPAKQSVTVYLRLTDTKKKNALKNIESVIADRKKEADQFYQAIHPKSASEDEKLVQRQALAGMIWNKQIYIYDVGTWLQGDNPDALPPESHRWIRNFHWRHIVSYRIFSMPDKWEFPWFAAWDLTFHALAFSLVDLHFAKNQLWLLLFDQFQHPNGAIPAYEWEFSDVNPPVQAWAVLKLFEYEKRELGIEDYPYLEKCFHKLLLNFSWWVNKVDSLGNNIFEGGFLGMDNIAFVDRSQKMPAGILVDEADGAGWISLFCLNLMRIALTLAKKNPIYEGLGIKFFQHFIFVTASMRKGYWRSYDMWNKEDGFFYSHMRYPDGHTEEIKIRSLVGIVPFFACDFWDEDELKQFPHFYNSYEWMVEKRADLVSKCIQKVPHDTGSHHLFGLMTAEEIQKFLKNIWDPNEFRSDYGLRSLSKYHEKNPAKMHGNSLGYEPGESTERVKGGNSNWRGPIWFPLNFLLIDTLARLGKVFKNDMLIQVGDEPAVNLNQMAESFSDRLIDIFKKDEKGNRPVFGDYEKFQKDPHFKDFIFFHEHFHGDNGRGLGASHQNGWTGLVANLIKDIHK